MEIKTKEEYAEAYTVYLKDTVNSLSEKGTIPFKLISQIFLLNSQ